MSLVRLRGRQCRAPLARALRCTRRCRWRLRHHHVDGDTIVATAVDPPAGECEPGGERVAVPLRAREEARTGVASDACVSTALSLQGPAHADVDGDVIARKAASTSRARECDEGTTGGCAVATGVAGAAERVPFAHQAGLLHSAESAWPNCF